MTPNPMSKPNREEKRVILKEEVNRRKIELIVYSAFVVGFIGRCEGRTLENPENFREIKRLIGVISQREIIKDPNTANI